MNTEWYYVQGGQQYGPISAAQLKSLAASGQLARTDKLWKEGMVDWVVAGNVKGLFSASAQQPSTHCSRMKPPPIPADESQPEMSSPSTESNPLSFISESSDGSHKSDAPHEPPPSRHRNRLKDMGGMDRAELVGTLAMYGLFALASVYWPITFVQTADLWGFVVSVILIIIGWLSVFWVNSAPRD